MLGVNGKPFLSLDNVIDTSIMPALHDEMCYGLAMVHRTRHSETNSLGRGDAALDLHDFRYKESAENDLTDEDRRIMKTMGGEQARRFQMIKYGVYLPWTYCVPIIDSFWGNKHLAEGKTITDEHKKLFPKTIEWVYSLPFFREIGRIFVYGVHPNHFVNCHRHADPIRRPVEDDMIMVSPVKNKPLFMYDVHTKTKHFVDDHVVVFNDMDFHGVEACTYFTYNFRVDGIYTPEWKEKIRFGR